MADIRSNLTSIDDNINVGGSTGDNTFITDFGGNDTYTILAGLAGNVTITDNDATVINLPTGLTVDSVSFAAVGAQFTVNGFTVTLLGNPANFTFQFGGTPLDPTEGTAKTYEETALEFGTTVPASVADPANTGQPGDINSDGSVDGVVAGSVFSVADVSVVEGDTGTTNLDVVITRTGDATTGAATVALSTADGTAGGADYVAQANAAVSFAVGELTKTVTISVNGDTDVEADETFAVNLSNATGASTISAAAGSATMTITNDDGTTGTFTLTTGADTPVMTSGDDTVDGTAAGTLNDGDVIIDNSTVDNDVLNAKIGVSVAPTIKNVETVNIEWTAGSELLFDATNTTGNTFNLTGTALAFPGAADIDEVGINDINADSTITGALTLQEVITSKIDAGSASTLALTKGVPITAGTKTSADITINGDIGTAVSVTNDIEELTITSTVDAKVDIATGDIIDSLTIAGDKNITLTSDLDGATVVNSLTAGTLTAKHDAAGTASFDKVEADLIEFAAAVTTATVADNQNFLVKNANAAAAIKFDAATGIVGATVNLEIQAGATAMTSLEAGTNVSTLNLDIKSASVISDLIIDATETVNIIGDSGLVLTDISITTSASIDASGLTGVFTIADADDVIVGIQGSNTEKNDFTLTNSTANATVITGAADDKISLALLTTGTAKLTLGGGDDEVTLDDALTTGKITIDGGAGTDTIVFVGSDDDDVSTVTKFDITSVENITGFDNLEMAGYMLDGASYKLTGTGANDNLIVNVVDLSGSATSVATDLSSLTFSNIATENFATISVVGMDDVADVMTGTALNDTFDGGSGNVKDTAVLGTGNDTVHLATGDSTYSTTADYLTSVTGFTAEAVSAAKGGDVVDFTLTGATAITSDDTGIDVKGAITGGNGSETVTAAIADGLLTISGVSSDQIDTLGEWIKVAQAAIEDTGADGLQDDILAFAFDGNTYVWANDSADTVASVLYTMVELVGVTGVTALNATGAANVIEVA